MSNILFHLIAPFAVEVSGADIRGHIAAFQGGRYSKNASQGVRLSNAFDSCIFPQGRYPRLSH
jgi:hypothetical protein